MNDYQQILQIKKKKIKSLKELTGIKVAVKQTI